MQKTHGFLMGAAATALVGFGGASAAAQTSGDTNGVGEITVTAQRVEQDLRSVPVAVTAVTGEDLESRKLNDLTQLTIISPSLQTTTDNAFSLRGVGSNIFLATVDSSVGVMVDDVSLGAPLFQSNGVFNDIARIEVLRGPQGILFGRNASAGLLHVVTQRPIIGETGGQFGLEYNNRDTADGGNFGAVARGTLNLSVSENAALRVNLLGSYQNPIAEAFIRSPAGARIEQDQTRVAGRIKYLWQPSAQTDVYVVADYSTERGVGGIWDRTLREIGGGYYAAALAQSGGVAGPDNLRYGIDAPGNYRSVDTYGASVNISHDLSPSLTLSNILSWRQYDLQLWLDTDYSILDHFNTNTHGSNFLQWSDELRLAFEGDRIDGQVGLYAFYWSNDAHTQLFASLQSGVPNLFGGDFLARNESQSVAAFGQVNFHLTDAFTVFAGARVTHDEVEMRTTQDVGTYGVPPGLYGPSGTFSFSESHTNVSYKLGAQYEFTPDVMAYVTYGTGYKGPAYPQNLGASSFDPYIEPETVENIELGVRSALFDRRLRLNVSGFYQEFEDFQVQTYDPVAALFRLANAGGLRSSGVEFDVVARPTDRLTINFGATAMETEFTDFITSCYPGQTAPQGCVSGRFQAAGLAPPGSPEFTSTLQGLYDVPIGANTLTLEANWFHRSDVNFSSNGDPQTVLPAFDIFGASLTYRLENGVALALFCKNCSDERVPSFLSHVTGDTTAIIQSWNYNSVRTIGASINIDF